MQQRPGVEANARVSCQVNSGGKKEQILHIYTLELKVTKMSIMALTDFKGHKLVQPQMDNIIALTYLTKMEGRTKRPGMDKITMEMWSHLVSKRITITA